MSIYWPQPLDRANLQDGDHILTYRHGGLYSHHGIYVAAERKVIHFDWRDHWYSHTGDAYNLCGQCGHNPSRMRMSCVDCFLRFKPDPRGNAGSPPGPVLHRHEYGVSQVHLLTHDLGTCSTQRSDGAEEVVRRAMEVYRSGTFGTHWRLWNNCESFAYYCKTGKYSVGKQFLRGLVIVPTTVSAL